jgi:hypothetical protein
MTLIRRSLMLLVLALGAATLPAQDEGAESADSADAAEAPRETAEGAGEAGAGDDADPGVREPEPEPDIFVPTEEIQADEEVVFPVDI